MQSLNRKTHSSMRWIHSPGRSWHSTPTHRVGGAQPVIANEAHTAMFLLDKHVDSVHLWHFLSDELHVEHVITVSGEARAVPLCATCSTKGVMLPQERPMSRRESWRDMPPKVVRADTGCLVESLHWHAKGSKHGGFYGAEGWSKDWDEAHALCNPDRSGGDT